jgi:hypothetical protein
MNWHGYFVVKRQTIGAGNWAALQTVFENMGTLDSRFPCYNNHRRTRLDEDAVIYESRFNTEEVSVVAFKQLLADEFGVPVENIQSEIDSVSYAGGSTAVWQFLYSDVERFKVERFGDGGSNWQQSGDECRGYLALYQEEWDLEP